MIFRSFFLFFFFSPSLMFSLWPSVAFANICLHPLEQAALFSGQSKKQSLSGRIERTKKNLEKLADNYEKLEDKISDWTDDLANSLKEDGITLEDGVSGAAEAISAYMEAKQDQWDTEGVPWHDPTKPRLTGQYFKRNGEVNEKAFCKGYAINKRDCEKSIKQLEKYHKKLSDIAELGEQGEELLEGLEDEKFNREIGLSDEDETEADGLCFECLDELRELDKPSTGQVVGNTLSILAGLGLSYHGYRAGKREAQSLNDLRLRQGYDPVSASGLSWAGASMGLPFISKGIYGLAGGNSRFGSFACSPGFANRANMYSPFGHYVMNAQAQAQFSPWMNNPMMNANAQAQFGPWMNNPMMNAQAQAQFGPWMNNPMNAQASMQFNNPFFNPMMNANAQAQFGPWMNNPMMNAQAQAQFGPWMNNPMINAQASMQFNNPFFNPMNANAQAQFSPWMNNPMMNANAQAQFSPWMNNPMNAQASMQFNNPWMNPSMTPGVNPQAQYQQQQYAQYQQFQQQQIQARMQIQQAWLQHQQSIQQEWMQKQQVIGSLTQEIYKIQQQIQLVASGGVGNSVLGTSSASLYAGLNLGNTLTGSSSAPTHNPNTSINTNTNPSGDLPVIESR